MQKVCDVKRFRDILRANTRQPTEKNVDEARITVQTKMLKYFPYSLKILRLPRWAQQQKALVLVASKPETN